MTTSPEVGPQRARRRIFVKGRVQGVWYRGACQQQAQALGVDGWARNLPDGRVEVLAEGAPEALDRLEEWCRQGPPSARVAGIEVWEERAEGLSAFEVR